MNSPPISEAAGGREFGLQTETLIGDCILPSAGSRSGMDSTASYRATSLMWSCFLLGLFVMLPINSVLHAADSDYVMMWQGSEWTFEVVTTKSDRVIDKGTLVVKVDGQVVRNGREYLQQYSAMKMSHPYEIKTLVRTDENGFFTVSGDAPDAKEEKQIAFPLKIGSAWETNAPLDITKNKIVGIENVIVNGKTYNDCFHVQVESAGGALSFWLAAGAGVIKVEAKSKDGELITMTLLEFKPGKAEVK